MFATYRFLEFTVIVGNEPILRRGEQQIPLQRNEARLLIALLERAHQGGQGGARLVRHEELEDQIWHGAVSRASLHQAVKRLRAALQEHSDVVRTWRGDGYYLRDDVSVTLVSKDVAETVANGAAERDTLLGTDRQRVAQDHEHVCTVVADTDGHRGFSFDDGGNARNGRFSIWTAFYILVGPSSLELMSLWTGYYAQGCLCLEVRGSIHIDTERCATVFGRADFEHPLKLQAGTTYRLKYEAVHRPPLMQQSPDTINAEYGDLVLTARIRVERAVALMDMRWVFSIESYRAPRLVEEVRLPPRLADSELAEWHRVGRLSDEEYRTVLAIRPPDRYLIAISQHQFGIATNVPPATLALLRGLYSERPPNS